MTSFRLSQTRRAKTPTPAICLPDSTVPMMMISATTTGPLTDDRPGTLATLQIGTVVRSERMPPWVRNMQPRCQLRIRFVLMVVESTHGLTAKAPTCHGPHDVRRTSECTRRGAGYRRVCAQSLAHTRASAWPPSANSMYATAASIFLDTRTPINHPQ